VFASSTTPSAPSWSSAWAASASAPSTSGTVSVAKKPKRSGCARASSAANSFVRRASARASFAPCGLGSRRTPGVEIERTARAISWRSISASAPSADHAGSSRPPASCMPSSRSRAE
jgi:hypothetical protein